MPRAARAAAALKDQLEVKAELIKGSGGIYEVRVSGALVARKTPDRGFPSEAEVVEAVRAAL